MKQLFLIAATSLLTGCAYTFVPHTPYLPATQNKGEIEARFASNLNLSRADLQVGYQATERLVLHTAFLGTRPSGGGTDFLSGELGAGYYYRSPNELWRLGLDAGVAHGGGSSSRSGCFECASDPYPLSESYRMGYTYGYVQPTVMLKADQWNWGLAVRLGHTYYHQFNEVRVDSVGSQAQEFNHAGHQSTFVQPTLLLRYQFQPWLLASGSFGIVGFLGPDSRLNLASPLVTQVGLHFVLRKSGGL